MDNNLELGDEAAGVDRIMSGRALLQISLCYEFIGKDNTVLMARSLLDGRTFIYMKLLSQIGNIRYAAIENVCYAFQQNATWCSGTGSACQPDERVFTSRRR